MSTADSGQDVWARLRDYCLHGHLERYPPLTEERAREWERIFGIKLPPAEYHHYTAISNGIMHRPEVVCYPPATEEQLRATEEQLGFPLPADLRRLYSEIANGGLNLGPVYVFHGAVGGCGEYAQNRADGRTIEQLVSDSGWRMHARLEEALLRNPGFYVVADSAPEGFIWLADPGCSTGLFIDGMTGRLYHTDEYGFLLNPPTDDGDQEPLMIITLESPSLSVWFERWLDDTGRDGISGLQELPPEMVETDDLPDPGIVWRGLYRFGPNWSPRSDDAEDDDSLSRYPLDG